MSAYRFFKWGRSYPHNARFGIRPFIGASRYVYYLDGRPMYYYSDRPYTLKDAKAWKSRGLISYAVLSACAVSLFRVSDLASFDSMTILVCIGELALAAFCIFRTILFFGLNPEEDPMLQSSPCDGGPAD